jgi:diadenosine tetraphosphate (Ap4A) HIT family hydrolase
MFCFHLHVVPRWRADELQLMWQEVRPAADAELADLRRRVLAAAPSDWPS